MNFKVGDMVMYDGNLGKITLEKPDIIRVDFNNGLCADFNNDSTSFLKISKLTLVKRTRKVTKTFYTGVSKRDYPGNYGLSLDGVLTVSLDEASKVFGNYDYIAKVEVEVEEEVKDGTI